MARPTSDPAQVAAGVALRRAHRGDLAELGTIWMEMMGSHARRDPSFALAADCLPRWQEMTQDLLGRNDAFVLVATRGTMLTGFCLGWVARNPPIYAVPEVGFISEMAVARRLQRQGIGRALMAAAQRWFHARRLTEYQLSTAIWNQEARDFWTACGGQPLLLRYRFEL